MSPPSQAILSLRGFRVVQHSTCQIIRKRDNESECQQNLSSLEQSQEGALSPLCDSREPLSMGGNQP
ncbi:hypothetical protein SRHO_G00301200 [Serrasalmus rhombeus]